MPMDRPINSARCPVLRNFSTRGFIGTDDNLMIGGFIVQRSQSATVVLRAIGPSLSAGGIAGALVDPMITVYDSTQNQIATKDDWFTSADAETIASFHLDPPNSREPALYRTLQPGDYTAVVQSFTKSRLQFLRPRVRCFHRRGQTGRASKLVHGRQTRCRCSARGDNHAT